ncbi:hypothetical protein [Leptolyngbya sp. 7M]|uniref:hypothetical protein n=1 Tax=Leptolyngbya sp. 7M TaxID=2812896 RepID=UPI001B8BF54A|nr:hypothetical protein [Leptolyngbya sp. 7M]QYO64132.1 hypothetical protein JVX88_30975 [Leptolyngbya sp. 7M]
MRGTRRARKDIARAPSLSDRSARGARRRSPRRGRSLRNAPSPDGGPGIKTTARDDKM